MTFYRNLNEMLNDKNLTEGAQVWKGEDGSYAVGSDFPIEVEEGETDYIEAGTVGDYRN